VAFSKALGVPYFLTEFGALSNSNTSAVEIGVVAGYAEAFFSSWSYWQFKYYHDITTAANPATTESFYFNNGSL